MTTAIGRAEKTGLRKVSPATNQKDRRSQHARQLFNERISRAEAEYYNTMRQIWSDDEAQTIPAGTPVDTLDVPA